MSRVVTPPPADSWADQVQRALQTIPHGPECSVLRWAAAYATYPEITMESGVNMMPLDGLQFEGRCTCDREQRMAQQVANAIDALAGARPVSLMVLAGHRDRALRLLTEGRE